MCRTSRSTGRLPVLWFGQEVDETERLLVEADVQKAMGLLTARAVFTNCLSSLMASAICRASLPERAVADGIASSSRSNSFESLWTSRTERWSPQWLPL